ncbi:hypothetical protein MNBD_PLANCTO02-235 [hydrothermal vent metagenome]|uniref:FecR protein domain-containing protein n=1 Tax=hydrothermal vent metagenome TaxID=652676 RepID=A0A3B1DXR4_9ZZZZ
MRHSLLKNAELVTLIYAAQDGTVTKSQFAELEERLKASARARGLYVYLMDVHAGLILLEEMYPTHVPRQVRIAAKKEISRQQEQSSKFLTWKRFAQPSYFIPLSLLFVSLFLGVSYQIYRKAHPQTVPQIAAQIVASPQQNIALIKAISGGELRTSEKLYTVNDHLKTEQQYDLKEGLLELEMSSGVEIVIAGPTTFQLLDSNKLRLLHGTITANVPHNAIGFTVNTPTMKVVDLGTQFGVHVNKEGVSETHVFKGIVDCFAVEGKESNLPPQRITAGKSLKRQAGGELVQSDSKSEELFATCLRQQAGIKSLSGDIKFLPVMPPSLVPCEFTSNDYIHLFPEKQGLVLTEDISCSVPVQNRQGNTGEKQFEAGVIKKGTKVNVYYIHFDAHCPGHPQFSIKTIVSKGDINFNREVLGILKVDAQLLKTDAPLGNVETDYWNEKMKSSKINRSVNDEILLTANNRGLYLNWKLSRGSIVGADCIRVIVQAEK